MNIDFTADRTVTIPAGTYYLCDPCYVVDDAEWGNIIEASAFLTQVYAEHERGVICAFSTANGDGTYTGTDGHSYDVDAGLIGLTDCRYWKGEGQPHSSRLVVFAAPVECSSRDEGGILKFADVTICTDDYYTDD